MRVCAFARTRGWHAGEVCAERVRIEKTNTIVFMDHTSTTDYGPAQPERYDVAISLKCERAVVVVVAAAGVALISRGARMLTLGAP